MKKLKKLIINSTMIQDISSIMPARITRDIIGVTPPTIVTNKMKYAGYRFVKFRKCHHKHFLRFNNRRSKISFKEIQSAGYTIVIINSDGVLEWLQKTFNDCGRYIFTGTEIIFAHQEDATLCIMRWL